MIKKILSILIIASFTIACMMSCKSTKSNNSPEQKIIIELEKNYTETYIQEKYGMYTPVKIKKSNKTLNQYLSTFRLDAVRYKGLINLLNEDDNVIRVLEKSNSGTDKPLKSTTSMKSAAKPAIK